MCAIEAGRRGRRVAVLEHNDRLGKKILISGGGRCNFTNIHCQPENFLSSNPHFAKSALARYTPADFIALVEKHRIPYHEKTLGQLFCDGSAREILNMLEEECQAAGVQIFLGEKIHEVSRSTEFFRAHDGCRVSSAGAGGRDRRTINTENWRDLLWVRCGSAVWDQHKRTVARLGAFDSASGRPLPLLRPDRRFRGCNRLSRQPAVSREDADHASRPERAGDFADLFLLEETARDCD